MSESHVTLHWWLRQPKHIPVNKLVRDTAHDSCSTQLNEGSRLAGAREMSARRSDKGTVYHVL